MSEYLNHEHLQVGPVGDFFRKLDFPLLRDQKAVLLRELERFTHRTTALYSKIPPDLKKLEDALDGILHMIDALQDAAVEAGIPAARVFVEDGDTTEI